LYASRLEELSAKQHEYEIKTADKKLISSLVSAYGSKGLKNLAFTQIAVSIQHYLNFFSDLLFAEQMSFSVTSTTTGISVIVTRPNGKQSDVRLLSGSESNCFSLIYLLTVLAMIPASRRTNFVVLDEMDSHMDDACRDRFYTKYVPILKTVVPNVFVITPKSIDTMSSSNMSVFDKVITIVKKGGVSNVKIDALGGSDENI
jgi:chromosome segregation ATPase